jgi:hypothetical protein
MMNSSPFMYFRSRPRYFSILYITFSWALSVFAIEQRNEKFKMLSDNVELALGVIGICSFSTLA